MTESMQKPDSPMRRLEPLIGTWDTRGEVIGEDGARQAFTATDAYWWVADGAFLYHDFVADMAGQRVAGFEVAGYDKAADRFDIRSYDNAGGVNDQTATMMGKTWNIAGETERFSGSFSEDGNRLTGVWERRDGGKWVRWMDVELMRRR
jgi:hypothetical protein